jgi:hypothetical protein
LVSGRTPLLYGLFVLLGVGAAVVLAFTLGGGTPSASPTAAPPTTVIGSTEPSAGESLPAPSPSPEPSPIVTSGPTATPEVTPKPTKTPKPTPTPNTNPTIVTFDVPKTEDCTNATAGTITLSWEIANATGAALSIDGPGVYDSWDGISQTVEVPFGCNHGQLTHTYTLTTMGGSGPADSKTKTVTAKPAKIKTFTVGPANCPSASGSVGVAMSFEIVAATGAQLKVDGAIYANYTGKTADVTIPFDCTKASQTFRLTTSGGYGEEDTMKVVVDRSLP